MKDRRQNRRRKRWLPKCLDPCPECGSALRRRIFDKWCPQCEVSYPLLYPRPRKSRDEDKRKA
jgi:hypothetical protein